MSCTAEVKELPGDGFRIEITADPRGAKQIALVREGQLRPFARLVCQRWKGPLGPTNAQRFWFQENYYQLAEHPIRSRTEHGESVKYVVFYRRNSEEKKISPIPLSEILGPVQPEKGGVQWFVMQTDELPPKSN